MLVSAVKRYLHISPTHYLLINIHIGTMSYHKAVTNDNFVHNIGNNKDVVTLMLAIVTFACFSMDSGRLSTSFIWSDGRLRSTDVYSEGVLFAIYVNARRKVVLLHHWYWDRGARLWQPALAPLCLVILV